MSTGITTVDQFEQAFGQQQAIEQQNVSWMEAGFATLGLVQVARKDASGLQTELVWAPRGQDQTANLPAGVVERARAALEAEQRARAVYGAKRDEALAYIAKHNLSSAAGQVHLELACAESWTAYQATQRPVRLAMRDLGRIAERAAQLRQIISRAAPRIAAIEQEAQRQIAQVKAEADAAQLEAMQLGIA